ncbi:uncharacterized protein LOC111716132 [Eurytemora carolleeae]|uniref:uncharacterized protein LOC111716132 n=1 Tax=Eurytemora carolleeae TaxID=1294199 RepID=UPI000C76F1C2|nr:uncharacterized protein LOC111716132 [Eurytemora carolleeae]|eukprot:XP_023347324.1 uncharacterized protein LOC111716132 [Eurytemora affinis]
MRTKIQDLKLCEPQPPPIHLQDQFKISTFREKTIHRLDRVENISFQFPPLDGVENPPLDGVKNHHESNGRLSSNRTNFKTSSNRLDRFSQVFRLSPPPLDLPTPQPETSPPPPSRPSRGRDLFDDVRNYRKTITLY